EWLSDLKVRGSWGVTGNNNIGNYTSQANMNNQNYILNNTLYAGKVVGAFSNAYLGWEKSNQLDIGIDVSLFNNKLTFVGEYYKKITEDMLLNVKIPAHSGFGSASSNVGKIQNKGFEFDLGYKDRIRDFTYRANFNMAFNKN